MSAALSRDDLPVEILTPRTIVRKACARDLEQIRAWPDYEWPYDVFSVNNRYRDGQLWWERIDEPDRCQYSVLLRDEDVVVGLHSFIEIDWDARIVQNMGVRIAPAYCGRNYGTESLAPLLAALLDSGMERIRLDVAATNTRAVRCYEKRGMSIASEFWREHKGEPIDPQNPKWNFIMPHLRAEGDIWLVRFYWMEINDGS